MLVPFTFYENRFKILPRYIDGMLLCQQPASFLLWATAIKLKGIFSFSLNAVNSSCFIESISLAISSPLMNKQVYPPSNSVKSSDSDDETGKQMILWVF